MQVECLAKDKKLFEELGFGEESQDGDVCTMFDADANYAHYGKLPDVVFTGEHGEGKNYGPMAFACNGKEQVWVERLHQGGPAVQMDKNGNIDIEAKNAMLDYYRITKEAETILNMNRRSRRYK